MDTIMNFCEETLTDWDLDDLCLITDEAGVRAEGRFPVFCCSENRIIFVGTESYEYLVEQGVRAIRLEDRLR